MTELINEIVIDHPIDEVFNYATAPYYWPQWHPSSVAVDKTEPLSLQENQTVVETIKVGFLKGTVTWTVREHNAPHLWVIQGVADNGGTAVLQYYLTHWSGKTQFRRVLNYQLPNIFMAVGDLLLGRFLMKSESEKALVNLQAALQNR